MLAILVPYRDRASYVEVFCREVPKYLAQWDLDYKIYIAEQEDDGPFNISVARNLAALAAICDQDYNYFVFQDVDMIPVSGIDYWFKPYNIGWFMSAGSCKIITTDFIIANGFNPAYSGWGSEDADFYHRMTHFDIGCKHAPNLPECQNAVMYNLEFAAGTSDEDALRVSKSYFGHDGQGPRFIPYPESIEHYRKGEHCRQDHADENSAILQKAYDLPYSEQTNYILANGLNRCKLANARRSEVDGVHWVHYRTDEVLV